MSTKTRFYAATVLGACLALGFGLAEAAQPSHQAVHWRFIPVLNPDGFLAKKPSRVNARGA